MPTSTLTRRSFLLAASGAALAALPRFALATDGKPAGWIAIRSYTLKPDADRAALIADTEASYLPLLNSLDGFVSFYVLQPDPLTWTGVSVWRDEAASMAALAPVKAWVQEHVAASVASGPVGVEGPLAAMGFGPAEMMATPVPDGAPSWATFRSYTFTPDADIPAIAAATRDDFLPLVEGIDGFEAFYAITPEPNGWIGLTIWRDKAAADAAQPEILGWVKANVLPAIDGEPVSTPGAVDIAAFAIEMVMATPEA